MKRRSYFRLCFVVFILLLFGGVGLLTRVQLQHHIRNRRQIIGIAPSTKRPMVLTVALLKHGEHQLVRMLEDRPTMKDFIQHNDPLWLYCVRQFAGEGVGEPIEWNSEPPPEIDSDCDNVSPSAGRRGFIRIRRLSRGFYNSRERRGEDLWADAIYELNNIQNSRQVELLDRAAWQGRLNKDDWIKQTTQLEYEALERSAYIYKWLWQPLMRRRNIDYKPYNYRWGIFIPASYDEWIDEYRKGDGSYLRYYATMYDQKLASHALSVSLQKKQQ